MSVKGRVNRLEKEAERRRPTSQEIAVVDVRGMTAEERRAAVGAKRAKLPPGQTIIVIDH